MGRFRFVGTGCESAFRAYANAWGEVACTGVQGANRLASNSLLEGLVFGRRAVEAFLSSDPGWGPAGAVPPLAGTVRLPQAGAAAPFSREALRSLMTSHAGVLRSGELLAEAAEALDRWAGVVRPDAVPAGGELDPLAYEDRNLLLAAQLLVRAAQERTDSLGAHYRSDSPAETAGLRADLKETPTMRPKASLSHD